jgi:nonsense-mediated mRNA decay protein 3
MSSGSRSGEFCPRCGDPIERPPDAELPDEPGGQDERGSGPADPDAVLCDACYFENFDLVDAPDRIEIRVCSRCGALHRGNRWVDVGARDYTDVAVEETAERLAVHVDAREVDWGVEPEQVDENTIRMHCLFTGMIRGTPLQEEVTVPVYVSRETCDRCGRIAGDYYASVVQVRGTDRTPTDTENDRAVEIAESYVAEREATGDRNAFITETERTKDGVDVKFSTNKLGQGVANHVVRELGGTVSESPTLVTEDEDGNEVYRVTFTARLPPYTPGDVVDLDDDEGPVLVTSAHGNLKGRRLETGDRYDASFEEGIDPDARKLGDREDAQRTTVVAVEDARAVQVLDPETFESKTVPRPDYMNSDADEVPVLKHREGLHVLPDDER